MIHLYYIRDLEKSPLTNKNAFESRKATLQRCGHCLFALLAEMAEHAYGDTRRKWPEVELPAPTLVLSNSLAALPSL